MADYQCWPLWHHGGAAVGNIDPRRLNISAALQARLQRWSEDYDSHLVLNDPASTHWSEEESAAFDLEGRRLCMALAHETGPRFAVFFFERETGRCIPALELFVTP